jgi:hypothetical protein
MEPMDPALSHVVTFVSATHAPVEDHRVAVSVPFNFVVGEQILPSGNYVITSRRKTPEFVCFGNRQKNVNIQTKGKPVQRCEQHTDELVFHKYRSLYFLTDIQFANSSVNIQFPATEAEKWIQAQAGELAPFPQQPVLIALN